jgi:hypothetical protein
MSDETYIPEIKPRDKKLLIWIGYELELPEEYKFTSENIEDMIYSINQGRYKNLPVRRVRLDKPGVPRGYSVTVEYN